MRHFLQKYVMAVATFFLLLHCSEAFAASVSESGGTPDFTYDMQSMIRVNPDFSTFPETNGIIWLKRLDYRNAPDGGTERRSLWVILGRKGLSSRWLTWNIPTPQDGNLEILQASVYSPFSSQKLKDVAPEAFGQNGSSGQTVSFTDLPDEYILVLSYREHFTNRLSIDDVVWVSESLPVWEEHVGVTVPAGYPFYYDSSPETKPQMRKVGDRTAYEWRIINTAATAHRSLRTDNRSYIAFGMREGKDTATHFLKNLESTAVPAAPAAVDRMLGKRVDSKGIEDLLRWLYKQPTFLLPDCTLRKIPAEAPWTTREKLMLAYGWLKNAGVHARLFWRLAYQPERGKPVCEALAMNPVLEISAADSSKNSSFYCDMDSVPRFGENSPSLRGQTIYGVNTAGKFEERKIHETTASDNRFSAIYDLRMNSDGVIGGTLRIQLRNAWLHFLLPSNPSADDLVSVAKYLFPALLRYSDIKLKTEGGNSEIVITLAETQAIRGTGGHHILVVLPALIPAWFGDLSKGPYPYTLDFPFTMDARITLTLPESVSNVLLPSPVDRNMGKIKYADSWKWNKKRLLSGEAHMTVATTSIADDASSALNSSLQGWHMFMAKNLPIQMKAKK